MKEITSKEDKVENKVKCVINKTKEEKDIIFDDIDLLACFGTTKQDGDDGGFVHILHGEFSSQAELDQKVMLTLLTWKNIVVKELLSCISEEGKKHYLAFEKEYSKAFKQDATENKTEEKI